MPIFKSHLYQMSAYHPPLEGRDVKQHMLLDFNERTIPVGQAVCDALVDYIRSGSLQKYPAYGDICEKIAARVGCEQNQLMITNGSDQGLDLAIRAACDAGDEVIIPAPSFAIYRQCAEVQNCKIIEPLFSREKGFPTEEVLDAISPQTRAIVIPNPNNPSGTAVARQDIIAILRAAPQAAVIIDECYYEYSGDTVVDLVAEYANLVVTRTFSKTWGLPSLRLGFVVSCAENIEQLLKVRGPYDVNQLAVVAVGAALAQPEYTDQYVSEVINISKPMFERWLDERGIEYWPSSGNYLWIFPDQPEAMKQRLQQENILVRPKQDASGRLGLRINLGTRAQTEILIRVCTDILASL